MSQSPSRPSSKKSVAVRIAGHEYKLLSEGDDDLLKQIARDVDRAMARVRERTGTVDTLDVAVLTCLNLAREIITLRDQRRGSIEDDKLQGLIERIEAAAGGATQSSVEGASTENVAMRSGKTKEDRRTQEPESARTLDLPSVETLRERTLMSSESATQMRDDAIPEARVASGGRERAS